MMSLFILILEPLWQVVFYPDFGKTGVDAKYSSITHKTVIIPYLRVSQKEIVDGQTLKQGLYSN